MKLLFVIVFLIPWSNAKSNALEYKNEEKGVVYADGKACNFGNLSPCKESLKKSSYNEILTLTDHVLQFINSKYKPQSEQEKYFHYLATIHSSANLADLSFSDSFVFIPSPFDDGLYGKVWRLTCERSEGWLAKIFQSYWNTLFSNTENLSASPLLSSKINNLKLFKDNKFNCPVKRKEIGNLAANLREEIISDLNKAEYILAITDKNNLIDLISFNFEETWHALHEEMILFLKQKNTILGNLKVYHIPRAIRDSPYLKPFVHQIEILEPEIWTINWGHSPKSNQFVQ